MNDLYNYQYRQSGQKQLVNGISTPSGSSKANLSDFNFLQKIGEGSYSSVHKVVKKSDNKEYALKKVRIDGLKPKEKENALNEVRILASINHPHIISYKDTFFDEKSNSLCIVMEFAPEGDVQKKIDKASRQRQYIPESEIWKLFIHCLRGLQVLHGMKILHRDIKCANIFIGKEGNYKLGDLNVSKVAKKGLVYTQTGTPYYASPEVWRDEPYDFKSDIWSLGCIIYELCALKPPFRAKNMEGLYQKVQKGVFDRIPRQYSEDLSNIISQCLKVSASLRPSCKQLLGNQSVRKNTQQFQNEPSSQEFNTMELESNFNLLNTIKVPKNMRYLADNLPKSKYEENANNSFDNADPRLMGNEKRRNKENQQRPQKISSALPKLEKENNSSLLPNIHQTPSQVYNSNKMNNENLLPKINNNQKQQVHGYENKRKKESNYHYIDGDSSYQSSQIRRKQPSDLQSIENQLARREQYLLGQQKGQNNHQSQNQLYNSNQSKSPYGGYQSPKISVVDSKSYNNHQQAQYYNQLQRNNVNSYSRIANLYENKQQYNIPSPISHKRSKNMQPFNPILQQPTQQRQPVWWG